MRAVPYRPGLRAPGVKRAQDIQRLFSFGTAVAAALVLNLTAFQKIVICGTGLVMFAVVLHRVLTRRDSAPYVVAQVDHAVAGLAIAVATASPMIVLAVGLAIVVAMASSFAAPPRLAIGLGLLWTVPQVVVAAVAAERQSNSASYLSPLIMIVLLMSLAILVLIFLRMQARQLRQALENRETQLEAVLASAPVLLASVGRDRAITTLAGVSNAWPSGEQLAATPAIAELIAEARGGTRVRREVSLGDRVLSLTCDPGTDGTQLLTAYDTTTEARARERLEELVRSKDQFIAAVSHELRTPLSAVLGYAEIVQETVPPDSELTPLISEVVSQSAEMAAIIDDLLVAARSSFETISTEPRRIDLTAEAVSVAGTLGSRLSTVPVYETQAPVNAYADPIRVRQIIRNLLTNADRYGGEQIVVSTRDDAAAAVIEVRDSGPPIPAELRDRIFEPYESTGPVRGQPAAIGLGLAVSRSLAELMGGSISYRHDRTWSVFELRLPARAKALEHAEAS
jgi:signal transduction histidine kinase